jgi:putative solute:sodium symporter small subunit
MESSDQYNLSIFTPRNRHGRKNRNVIFTMLAIWALAVFGFQILLRVIEKPVPEKALTLFEEEWYHVTRGNVDQADYKTLLGSLLMARGKITVTAADQLLLSEAISNATFTLVPDSVKPLLIEKVSELEVMHAEIASLKGQPYLDLKFRIQDASAGVINILEPFTGFGTASLEAPILAASLQKDYPGSLLDPMFARLPVLMKLYMTHNQSALTDTKFLGFPFHYFYTAVFLLVLFVVLCIVYNKLIEWRLNKEGIVE